MQHYLLQAQGLETVEVQHDIKLRGISGYKHQIDVYWEYRLAGITHKIALECKLHGRKVGVGVVRDFWGVLDDIAGLRGVIISPVGFTAGAKKFAESKGIGLKVVRPAQDKDYKGRIRGIHVTIVLQEPINLKLEMAIDRDWLEKNKTHALEELVSDLANPKVIATDGVFVEENTADEKIFLVKLPSYLPTFEIEDQSKEHTWKKDFTEGFLCIPSKPRIKLAFIKVHYKIRQTVLQELIGGYEIAHVLVQDAIEGTLLFVDEQGKVSGDTIEEGIAN